MGSPANSKTRRDVWTPERQLRFLAILAQPRSVSGAAAGVGMSHESPCRLRKGPGAALLGVAWDRALEGTGCRTALASARKFLAEISRSA